MGSKSSSGLSRQTIDQAIAGRAKTQHGAITLQQMFDLGLSPRAITARVEAGRLIRIFRGVYLVGHCAPNPFSTYKAAALACGGGSVLGRLPSAWVHNLIAGHAPAPFVYTPTERKVPGIQTCRMGARSSRARTTCKGIPVTTASQTVIDLAAVLDDDELASLVHMADVKGVRAPQIERNLARFKNLRGAPRLRRILRGEVRVVLSKLETHFLEVLDQAGIPLPQTNKRSGERFVDCWWPGHGLRVELDSFSFHNTYKAWEDDRERAARRSGDEFRRFTWRDVTEDTTYMLGELRRLLDPPS